eukprot:scaffold13544_cov67-Phaeocystis_antarctica.AAC.2
MPRDHDVHEGRSRTSRGQLAASLWPIVREITIRCRSRAHLPDPSLTFHPRTRLHRVYAVQESGPAALTYCRFGCFSCKLGREAESQGVFFRPSDRATTTAPSASMRSALLLFLLPGLAATDNAVCKVLSSFIDGLNSAPGLSCSCKSDGTALNIGGDAECDLAFGPPTGVDALKDMKITFHAGTTVRPCATTATASLVAGISLPVLSSVKDVCSLTGGCSQACKDSNYCIECKGTCASLDENMDTLFSTAITELKANADMQGEVAYDESTNKITVSLTAEAGVTKEIEVPIQKWGVADFFAKVSLKVEGSMSGLTTTQAVDLCMKEKIVGTEICGADIPKCDGTDTGTGVVGAAQKTICLTKFNWHELFGSPPITMFPPQKLSFTDACVPPSPPPPPPTATTGGTTTGGTTTGGTTTAFATALTASKSSKVTLALRASGSVADYSDTSGLKAKVASAAGVGASDVEITVSAASVLITAVINVPSSTTADAVSVSLSTKLNSVDAASTALGITVEAVPTVVTTVYITTASECDNGGAAAGAVISVLLFIGTIGTVVYLVKKERIANPLDRLKEKLGKKKVYVMENGANAELAAAKPA